MGNAEEKSAEAVVVKKAAERQQERRAEELRNGLATKLLGYSKVDGKPRKKNGHFPKPEVDSSKAAGSVVCENVPRADWSE